MKEIFMLLMGLIGIVTRILFHRKNKMFFLFGSPFHPNMGDQAQTYCILEWCKKNYPEYYINTFRMSTTSNKTITIIRSLIRKDDIIICHSGYHLTNLYHEQDVYFKVIKRFPDIRIIIFPQTINYTNDAVLTEAINVINSHPNLTIMCRDEKSFSLALEHFKSSKLLLYPDIVTSIIGTKRFTHYREGILFCMRNDIEAFYKPEQIEHLRLRFKGIKTNQTDTTLLQYKHNMQYLYKHREDILNDIFNEYSKYKVIITDRYHGTIFSLIAGTPVVVIGSTDHKLSSGVKWFPQNIFGEYITFANNLDEAYEKATDMLNNYNKYTHILPAYFKEHYYDILKQKLET